MPRRPASTILRLVGLMAGGCAGEATVSQSAVTQQQARAIVERVIDGDTIVVDLQGEEETIRLIGIDTPEKSIPKRNQTAECFGEAASTNTRSLLPEGTEVYLERDVEARDDYGRLLAYVYRADDDVFINYEIVRHGYAQPLTFAPNTTHADLFVEAARAAEADNIGLWHACRNG